MEEEEAEKDLVLGGTGGWESNHHGGGFICSHDDVGSRLGPDPFEALMETFAHEGGSGGGGGRGRGDTDIVVDAVLVDDMVG